MQSFDEFFASIGVHTDPHAHVINNANRDETRNIKNAKARKLVKTLFEQHECDEACDFDDTVWDVEQDAYFASEDDWSRLNQGETHWS